MSAATLINYFSSHWAAFRLWASLPPDNISLNTSNKKTDQSLPVFQTGIGAAAPATLDTGQLISHTRASLADTVSYLQGSNRGPISVSKVHELLTEIFDILDCAVSNWVGIKAWILAFILILLPGTIGKSAVSLSEHPGERSDRKKAF